MIRIKTLRKLIEITHKIVEEYSTRSYRYMTFDEYLERLDPLDIEDLARDVGLSERTMYDYVSAIKELCGIFGRAVCQDMTDNQEFGHNVTDVQGQTEDDFLVNCQDMTENQEFCHDVTDVKGAEIL